MAIEPAIPPLPAVLPVGDAERSRPDTQPRRDRNRRRDDEQHHDAAPAPNERGEITGKLVDILA